MYQGFVVEDPCCKLGRLAPDTLIAIELHHLELSGDLSVSMSRKNCHLDVIV